MRTLAILLCLATAAAAQAKVKQQDPPATDRTMFGKKQGDKGKKPSDAVDVSVKSGTDIGYDDNILELNDKQIKQLESGLRPEKFRIDQPEDFVTTVWAEVRVKGRWIGDTTHAGLKIQPHFYMSSDIANYQEYDFFIRQDIAAHDAGITYHLEYDEYLRELEIVVPGPNLWESARYNEHDVELYYRHEVTKTLSVRPMAGWRFKDFDSPFQFRDLEGLFLGVGAKADVLPNASVFVKYEYADMDSEAGSLDPDTSYRQHEVEVGGGVLLLNLVDVSLKYRLAIRDYTSTNSPLVDPSHFDREDLRHKVTFRAKMKLTKDWSVHLEYIYRHVDSDRPFDNDATTSEPGNATRNVVAIGATVAF